MSNHNCVQTYVVSDNKKGKQYILQTKDTATFKRYFYNHNCVQTDVFSDNKKGKQYILQTKDTATQ